MERIDADFIVQGVRCAAWYYQPDGEGPYPCVVMAHGFSATRSDSLPTYAEAFAAAGLAVLLFDYRYFGDSDGEPRQLLDIGRQLADWRAAIAHARALPDIDPERIGLWGSSFSGGHVITVASEDHRIAAIVAQAPYVDGVATVRIMEPAVVAKASVRAVRDQLAALLGHKRVMLAPAGVPGSTAALTAPEVVPGFEMIVSSGTRWRNEVTAAVLLKVPFYSPARKIDRITAPMLFCICDRDATVPPLAAAKAAQRAQNAEVVHYDAGHFEVYVGDTNVTAVADQTAFFTKQLQ